MSERRVGVVLDSNAPVAIREAARLAAARDAELDARFVEDEELLSLAGHDFASCVTCGRTRELHERDLEHEWQTLGEVARAAVTREAKRHGVAHRFQTHRGVSAAAIEDALAAADLVLVSWGGFSPRAARGAPVRVLFDGTAPSVRALELGAELAGRDGQLAVWFGPGTEASLDVEDRVGRLRVATFIEDSVGVLRRALADEPGGLLLVPAGGSIDAALRARSGAARFSASVVLVA